LGSFAGFESSPRLPPDPPQTPPRHAAMKKPQRRRKERSDTHAARGSRDLSQLPALRAERGKLPAEDVDPTNEDAWGKFMAAQPFKFITSPAQFEAFVEGQIAARWERKNEASRHGRPYSEQKRRIRSKWERGWYQWAVWVGGEWCVIYGGKFASLEAVLRYCRTSAGHLAPFLGDCGMRGGGMDASVQLKRFALQLLQREACVPLGFRFVISSSAKSGEDHGLTWNHILNSQQQETSYRFDDLWELVEPNSECSAQHLAALWEEEFGEFGRRHLQ
jgi:hypothetical protein